MVTSSPPDLVLVIRSGFPHTGHGGRFLGSLISWDATNYTNVVG